MSHEGHGLKTLPGGNICASYSRRGVDSGPGTDLATGVVDFAPAGHHEGVVYCNIDGL